VTQPTNPQREDITWDGIEVDRQTDLLAWFNSTKPDAEDKQLLAELHYKGRFAAWNCPICGERCYFGDPDDWGPHQGANQVDYTSYPGEAFVFTTKMLRVMCDTCRGQGTRVELTFTTGAAIDSIEERGYEEE
jgi:hypothetical protein